MVFLVALVVEKKTILDKYEFFIPASMARALATAKRSLEIMNSKKKMRKTKRVQIFFVLIAFLSGSIFLFCE